MSVYDWNPNSNFLWSSGAAGNGTFSDGDSIFDSPHTNSYNNVRGNVLKSSGKWYWETLTYTETTGGGGGTIFVATGIASANALDGDFTGRNDNTNTYGVWSSSHELVHSNTTPIPVPGLKFSDGNQVIRHKLDMDTGVYEVAGESEEFVVATSTLDTAVAWGPSLTNRRITSTKIVTNVQNASFNPPAGYQWLDDVAVDPPSEAAAVSKIDTELLHSMIQDSGAAKISKVIAESVYEMTQDSVASRISKVSAEVLLEYTSEVLTSVGSSLSLNISDTTFATIVELADVSSGLNISELSYVGIIDESISSQFEYTPASQSFGSPKFSDVNSGIILDIPETNGGLTTETIRFGGVIQNGGGMEYSNIAQSYGSPKFSDIEVGSILTADNSTSGHGIVDDVQVIGLVEDLVQDSSGAYTNAEQFYSPTRYSDIEVGSIHHLPDHNSSIYETNVASLLEETSDGYTDASNSYGNPKFSRVLPAFIIDIPLYDNNAIISEVHTASIIDIPTTVGFIAAEVAMAATSEQSNANYTNVSTVYGEPLFSEMSAASVVHNQIYGAAVISESKAGAIVDAGDAEYTRIGSFENLIVGEANFGSILVLPPTNISYVYESKIGATLHASDAIYTQINPQIGGTGYLVSPIININ